MKRILGFCFLLFNFFQVSFSQTIQEKVFKINIEDGFLEGSFIPSENKNKLAIIVAGSGPTDRNGNNPLGVKSNSYKILADELAAKNIASIRYDKRGIAKSKLQKMDEGKMLFSDFVNDAIAMYHYAQDSLGYQQVYFIGHSEGSLIAMLSCLQTKAAGYISLSGAARSIDEIIEEQLEGQPEEIKQAIHEIFVSLKEGKTVDDVPQTLYTLFRPSIQPYMISWIKYKPTEEIKKLTIPILIVNGTCDKQVKDKEANLLYEANKNSKLLIIKNMTHALKDTDDACEDAGMKTYKDATLPLNKELVTSVSDFILERK